MSQGNQAMGLAAAVRRVEPKDRRDLASCPAQSATHVREKVLESARGVGVREEEGRIGVLLARLTRDDWREVSGEVSLGDGSSTHVLAETACVEDRR